MDYVYGFAGAGGRNQQTLYFGKDTTTQIFDEKKKNISIEQLEEFKKQSHLTELWSGMLKTQLYTRWMIIGTV